jgi:arylsulfatase A-like enzyme
VFGRKFDIVYRRSYTFNYGYPMSIQQRFATAVGALLAIVGGGMAQALDSKNIVVHPNIVLIVCDDLNDYEGCYGGHPKAITPNIDRLSKRSVRFTNAHTNAPVCLPSRSSFCTGIYPHHSGLYGFKQSNTSPVFKIALTFSQYFSKNGYVTLGTGKIMHENNQGRYFDEYGILPDYGPHPTKGDGKFAFHPSMPPSLEEYGFDAIISPLSDVPRFSGEPTGKIVPGWMNPTSNSSFRYSTDQDRDLLCDELSADWSVKKIEKHGNEDHGKPYLMAVGFMKPHTPLTVPQKYYDMYPLDTMNNPPNKANDYDDIHEARRDRGRGGAIYDGMIAHYGDEGNRRYAQAYLACVTFVDEQIGKVLDAVELSKERDNTIIILTSDHGFHVGEKRMMWKNTLWGESTRVPLIVHVPAKPATAGAVCNKPVSLIDLYPTMRDYAGLDADTRKTKNSRPLDGFSLRPFIDDPDCKTWSGPDAALTTTTAWPQSIYPNRNNFSIRTERWRYTRYAEGSEELYDTDSDPNEWDNLAKDVAYAEVKNQHLERLRTMVPDLLLPDAETSVHRFNSLLSKEGDGKQ